VVVAPYMLPLNELVVD